MSKRTAKMTDKYTKYLDNLDAMSKAGVKRQMSRIVSDPEREGYPVQSMRHKGYRSAHVTDVCPIRWGHGIRIIFSCCAKFVYFWRIGDHRHHSDQDTSNVKNSESDVYDFS